MNTQLHWTHFLWKRTPHQGELRKKKKILRFQDILDFKIIRNDIPIELSLRHTINASLFWTLIWFILLVIIGTISVFAEKCPNDENIFCILNDWLSRDNICKDKNNWKRYSYDKINYLGFKTGKCYCCAPKADEKVTFDNPWIFGFGITASVLIIFTTSVLCGMRKMSNDPSKTNVQETQFQEQDNFLEPTAFKKASQASNILRTDFSFDKLGGKLGEGQFGVVYKGSLQIENEITPVAIKTIRDDSDNSAITAFLNELHVMNSVGIHSNIAELIGVCVHGDVFGILELCENGNLKSYLQVSATLPALTTVLEYHPILNGYMLAQQNETNQNYVKDWDDEDFKRQTLPQFVLWAKQIADGLNFLELKKIIHIDIAARNILLTKSLTAKISDFGFSRKLYYKDVYDKAGNDPIPLKWLALEALTENKYSTKSDIWSYAVTLWEIFSFGKDPFDNLGPKEFVDALIIGKRLLRPEHCSEQIYSKMLSCWDKDPEKRPSSTDMMTYFANLSTNSSRETIC